MDPVILNCAARDNNVAEVKRLICLGADVNMKDEFGWSALHFAARKNEVDSHFEVIELLLKSGADVNALDDLGNTPIHELVNGADLKTVKLLLDFGADLSIKDKNDFTSLFFAVCNNTIEVIKLLVKNGADAGIKRNGYLSIFHSACRGKITEVVQIVKYLIKNGLDIEARDKDIRPPLTSVLETNFVPLLRFFCKCNDFSFNGFCESFELSSIENKDVWMKLLEHLAKLKTLNITVHQSFFQKVSKRQDFVVYFEECTKELEVAKSTKIKNFWVTYFNLLVDSKRKLKNYASNRDLVQEFKNSDCIKKFPIYAPEMQKNMDKAIKRRKAFDKSAVALSNCWTILNPTHLIIMNVLDCLSHKDYILFLSK